MRASRLLAILGLSAVLALTTVGQEKVQRLTGFRVPQYDENNNLKSELFGDFAKVMPNGNIEITQLRIDFYSGGEVEMTVTAPECKYNQRKGVAESDSDVRISRENMVVTGKGFTWNAQNEKLEIYSEAKVVLVDLRRQQKAGGATE